MPIGVKLYSYLLQNPAITDLVSNRIFPLSAPQNSQQPYLTFRVVSDFSQYTLDGDTGEGRKQIQINVIFEDYTQANDISEVIKEEMLKWPQSEPDIQIITKTGYAEVYDENSKNKRIDLDFEVFAKN
jgi:hypothetical protein